MQPVRGDETELEMARRHVTEGRVLVRRQRQTLAKLRENGHPTATAEQLLLLLESIQALYEDHLVRLEGCETS
jgi:hypothetical protein